VCAALGLAGYAATIDHKFLLRTPTIRKQREAQDILESEILNAKIIEILPSDSPAISPAIAPSENNLGSFEELQALARSKFTVGATPASAPSATTEIKSRNVEVNAAIASVEAPPPAQADTQGDKWEKFKTLGKRICDRMVVTEKSLLIASGTGTGKTTTEQYLLTGLVQNYPTTNFYALLQKNDRLVGVPRENTYVFDNFLLTSYLNQAPPEEDEDLDNRITLRDIFLPLFETYEVFYSRKSLEAVERDRLKRESPVRLILGDWFATYQEIKRLSKSDRDTILSFIRQIITVGRDSGVGLIVDSQSASLASLGLAEDASIRESLDIYSQGYVRWEGDEEKGETRTMLQIINNNSMVGKDDREGLKNAYILLTNGIASGEVTSPIIFSTVGSMPTIGIVPDLSKMTVRDNQRAQAEPQQPQPEPETEPQQSPTLLLSEDAAIALEIIQTATQPCSFDNLRKSRRWGDKNIKIPDLRIAIQELIDKEKIEGDEEEGYIA
jgi:hypothetical protein